MVGNQDNDDVSVFLGNGDGTFVNDQRFPAGDRPRFVAIDDFNMDGIIDLAVANEGSGDVSILLGAGNGTFAPQQTFTAGGRDGDASSVTTGDFNGDGLADVATSSFETGFVSVLLGSGNGIFSAQQSFGAGTRSRSVIADDLDGCLLYTSPSPRDKRQSRMPSSA